MMLSYKWYLFATRHEHVTTHIMTDMFILDDVRDGEQMTNQAL